MGFPVDQYRFNEPMPDESLILQGEVVNKCGKLWLAYCRDKVTMRVALGNLTHVVGLQARMILKGACDATSFVWIEELLERYPNHAIEFSAFEKKVGHLNLNTVIWEVRRY